MSDIYNIYNIYICQAYNMPEYVWHILYIYIYIYINIYIYNIIYMSDIYIYI